jgi:iron complex outermembrane receptor protein
MMVYLKYSEGFRAGGATASPGLAGGGAAFDQDTVGTVELGGRFEFMDGRLRVNPTIFQTDWSDIQVNDVLPGNFGPVISTNNIGDAEITGLELETLFAVTEELTLNASLSVMDSKFTKVDTYFQPTYPNGVTFVIVPGAPAPVPTGAVFIPNLTLDSDLNRAPELKYTIGGTYKHALSSGAEVSSSLSYSYTDEQRSSTADFGHVMIDDYALVNARIQFTSSDEQWLVAVVGSNLTDEEYLVGGTNFANGYTIGVNVVDPGRGREVGLEVQYNF